MSEPTTDLCRPLASWEKAALAPPHPGDFGIPKQHWEAAQHYADFWHANRLEARRPTQSADRIEAYEALLRQALDALALIAGTDPVDAALDPQRAIRVARPVAAALSARLEKP